MRQLLLNVFLRDDASFENFYPGSNQAVLDYLKKPQEKLIYLYSKPHAGLTHILQALCKISPTCTYIPLEKISEFTPEILNNLANLELIIVDDIEKIVGLPEQFAWEEKLFDLYNQIAQKNKRLIVSSHVLPQHQNFQLRDLKSRLQAMLLLTLKTLTDDEKIRALQLRAHYRGLQLPTEVAQYLMNRVPRDMEKLVDLVLELDRHSLQEKRRLTIPLAKEILDEAR